jgi:hypothetical protein
VTHRERRLAGALTLLLGVVALAVGSGTATAQTPAPSTASGSPALELLGQTPWAAPGGLITLELQASGIPAGSTLALTVHDRVQSRSAFDESVAGGSLGSTRTITRVAFDELPTNASGHRVALIAAPTVESGGVYPVEVDVRGPDDEPITGFTTHLVVAQVTSDGTLAVGQPLSVAWVWPLRAAPAYLPDGSPDPAVVDELASTGRLGRQAATLATTPGVPVTIAPSPETLEAWQALGARFPDLASGPALLRTASGHVQVVTGPYVPLDYPSIIAAGRGGGLAREPRR